MANFQISYTIRPREWLRAQQSRLDPDFHPVFHGFFGTLKVVSSGEELFGPEGFEMSIADLACGLAAVLETGFPDSSGPTEAEFKQADDALRIRFRRLEEIVRLSANLSGSTEIDVPRDELKRGIIEFLERFTREAASHIPTLFSWSVLSSLEPYR